jgi:hypothetical protein
MFLQSVCKALKTHRMRRFSAGRFVQSVRKLLKRRGLLQSTKSASEQRASVSVAGVAGWRAKIIPYVSITVMFVK